MDSPSVLWYGAPRAAVLIQSARQPRVGPTPSSRHTTVQTCPAAPTRVRSLVFALACGISFLLYLHRYTWGFVKKDVRDEFGWDPSTLGWLDGLFGISYGVG